MPTAHTVRDVYDYLCSLAPLSLAEEWDPVGLQVGNLEEPLTGILVSLDVTEAALREAAVHGANLLITHHPLFFRPIARLDDSAPVSRCARLATRLGINIFSFHTNLDSTPKGLNDVLANSIGLKRLKPLLASRDPRWPKAGLGRVGQISKTTLGDFLKIISKKLSLSNFRYVGDPKRSVERIAVMTGSGGSYFAEAKSAGADVLVTGDVKYHQAMDSLAQDLTVIDIGHYAGEIGMVALVAGQLRTWCRQKKCAISVWETQVGANPFRFYSD